MTFFYRHADANRRKKARSWRASSLSGRCPECTYLRPIIRLADRENVCGFRHPYQPAPHIVEKSSPEAKRSNLAKSPTACSAVSKSAAMAPAAIDQAMAEIVRALLSRAAASRSSLSASACSALWAGSRPSFRASHSSINASRRRGHQCQAAGGGSRLGVTCLPPARRRHGPCL